MKEELTEHYKDTRKRKEKQEKKIQKRKIKTTKKLAHNPRKNKHTHSHTLHHTPRTMSHAAAGEGASKQPQHNHLPMFGQRSRRNIMPSRPTHNKSKARRPKKMQGRRLCDALYHPCFFFRRRAILFKRRACLPARKGQNEQQCR